MTRTPLQLCASLAAGILIVAAAQAADGIKVNGRDIPQSRIDMAVKSQVGQGQQDTPELRNAVRDTLINQEILSQEALKRGLEKRPEVAMQLDFMRQDVLSNAFLQDYLRSNPVTDEAIKK